MSQPESYDTPDKELDEAIALLQDLGPRLMKLTQSLETLDHEAAPPVRWAAVHVAPIVYFLQAARTNFPNE